MNLLSKKIVSFLFVASMLFANGLAMEKRRLTLEEQLFHACCDGDLEKVKKLLKHKNIDVNKNIVFEVIPRPNAENSKSDVVNKGYDVNKGDVIIRWTPFHKACNKGHLDIVKEFLKHPEIDPNKEDKSSANTPLYSVCRSACLHLEVVKELLKHPKIDVNKEGDEDGSTPLHAACAEIFCSDVIKELLKNKDIDVNKGNKNGATPLHVACYNGRIRAVTELLKHKDIKVKKKDNYGSTPLKIACAAGKRYASIVKILLKHKDIKVNKARK